MGVLWLCGRVVVVCCCVLCLVSIIVVLCGVWCWKNHPFVDSNVPVYAIKPSPRVPAPRAHVETHVRVLPANTESF